MKTSKSGRRCLLQARARAVLDRGVVSILHMAAFNLYCSASGGGGGGIDRASFFNFFFFVFFSYARRKNTNGGKRQRARVFTCGRFDSGVKTRARERY